MNPFPLLCLVTFWSLGFAYQVTETDSPPPKLQLRPGDLLKSLDELTSDAQVIYSPLEEAAPSHSKSANRRAYDDGNPDAEPDSEFEYDRAYEDFVSKYFAQGEDDLESEDESSERGSDIDDVVPYGSSAESDEEKNSPKSKKCERVRIDDENCVICEDPKTNEKSKSCSYSSESKPKSYGFIRERSTKKTKDDDDDEVDEDHSDKGRKSLKRETVAKKNRIQPRKTSIKAFITPSSSENNNSPKCLRKKEGGMICYYCGTATENTRECMTDKSNPKKRRLDESSKQNSKTKKVFKRMVTYSYKNDADPEVKQNTYAALREY